MGEASLQSAVRADEILPAIEARLGFVPPFFTPAIDQPAVLWNLWQQTLYAYLENPLPGLFKEKLAAVLGRYCPVRYCLVSHACSLVPLGMRSREILELLKQPTPGHSEVHACIARADAIATAVNVVSWTPEIESDVMCLAIAIFRNGTAAANARHTLARILDPQTFNDLITFISYNRMCHDWISAHPDISHELHRRYIDHSAALISEESELVTLFASSANAPARHDVEPGELAAQQDIAAEQLARISEDRLQQVLKQLKEQVARAEDTAAREQRIQDELRHTANFAQELVAIVSHDLRNPLSAITNIANVLARSHDSKTVRAGVVLKGSAGRATRLIGDLLDFSQARIGGGIPIKRSALDIHIVTAEAITEMERSNPERHISLDRHGDGAGSWDRERLQQALVNLLANALTHSPPDSTVEVISHCSGEEVSISIVNRNLHGPIPLPIRQTLFDPFKRYSTHAENKSKSIGLGLYIVDQIVRGHGGRIEIDSNAAVTEFRLLLPRTG